MKNLKKLKRDNSIELSLEIKKQQNHENPKILLPNENEIKKEIKEFDFWENSNGKIKINHLELMEFFSSNGFYKFKFGNSLLVIKESNNWIEEVGDDDLIDFVKSYLKRKKKKEVLEVFTKGVGSYLSLKKMSFLDQASTIKDKDDRDNSKIFFNNCFVSISKIGFEINSYKNLKSKVWKNRILKRDFELPKDNNKGQFEQFCFNISKKDEQRFFCLKTLIGYLLHRNKERGEAVAVILYDELMSSTGETNGRTGKTLISIALNELREVITFDGKNSKKNSWFKFQRVNVTTDILNFDDLDKNTSLEEFYSLLTSGLEIEKKRKDAIKLEFLESPKVLLSSNHIVKGPGGSSDNARRHEFEIANYYDAVFTPEIEFETRFFGNYWTIEEWNKFYKFMIDCILLYLKNGLVKAEPINFIRETVIEKTSNEFFKWIEERLRLNQEEDKRAFHQEFINQFTQFSGLSSHRFTKWLNIYANYREATYSHRSSGGEYYFTISKS
ncbi:hypothetical protein [Psychroserpens mesophilus]|uniref:hypothetical protein n=1 Tax=Psychroserpens mesophilus TaxID=325473 RepID=UPI003D65058A